MGKKINKIIEKILLILAIVSFVVAFAEGMIYYSPAEYSNGLVRYLLIIQNTIRAFVFKTDIKIEDVADAIKASNSVVEIIVSYIYLVIIFIAPYCTLSFGYKFLKQVFFFGKKRHNRKYEGIIIIGYNDEVKVLLEDYHEKNKSLEKYKIHLVDEGISSEEEMHLLMSGVIVHKINCMALSGKELKNFFFQIKSKMAKYIIFFDESSVKNFSLYKFFNEEKQYSNLDRDVKFICRCENPEISAILEDYHDNESEYDMETVSIPELRVRHTLKNVPLHKFYESKQNVTVNEWDLHLLLVGFGKLGQQVLLQAMNHGVVSSTNKILVDVVDIDIEKKSSIFANVYNEDYVQIEKDQMLVSSDKSDGEFRVRFHKMDIRYKQFLSLLKEYGNSEKDGIFTYAAICVEDEEIGIHCLKEVQRYFNKSASLQHIDNVPIVIRMEMNKYMKKYINEDCKTFKNVVAMESSSDVLTLEKLIRGELDENAKEFNRIYNSIQIVSAKDARMVSKEKECEDVALTRKELWRDLKLFRRESNRALAEHALIKEVIWKNLINNEDTKQQLMYFFGQDGVLLKERDGIWTYDSEDEFVEKQSNRNLYPAVSELSRMEHRRWNYFMISRGWGLCQQGDEKLEKRILEREKRTVCLCTWEDLVKVQKDTCKYDLMWLLKKYNDLIYEGEKK